MRWNAEHDKRLSTAKRIIRRFAKSTPPCPGGLASPKKCRKRPFDRKLTKRFRSQELRYCDVA